MLNPAWNNRRVTKIKTAVPDVFLEMSETGASSEFEVDMGVASRLAVVVDHYIAIEKENELLKEIIDKERKKYTDEVCIFIRM